MTAGTVCIRQPCAHSAYTLSPARPAPMNILVDSSKPFDLAVADLQRSVAAHGFSVLHADALSDTLAAKGHPIPRRCSVLEVCNAGVASRGRTAVCILATSKPSGVPKTEAGVLRCHRCTKTTDFVAHGGWEPRWGKTTVSVPRIVR